MLSNPSRPERGYSCHAGALTVHHQDISIGTPDVTESRFGDLEHSRPRHCREVHAQILLTAGPVPHIPECWALGFAPYSRRTRAIPSACTECSGAMLSMSLACTSAP